MPPLTDKDIMPMGKFIGYKMQDVPAWHLLWFKDNVPATYANQSIHDYIKENLKVLQKENINPEML